MQKNTLPQYLLAGLLALTVPLAVATEIQVGPDQVVTAIEGAFGVTPGERRNHITQKSATCATAAPDFMQVPGHFLSSKLATSE